MPNEPKPSRVEEVKQASQFLHSPLAEELSNNESSLSKDAAEVLKFHGGYQQDDRDARMAARAAGKKVKNTIFMVRTKIPGGQLTSQQLLAEIDLGEAVGDGSLRITSRQGLQLHGIAKGDLAALVERVNACGLSTLGACGDVNRNVMCCPAPHRSPVTEAMQQLARDIADHLAPRTTAYRDIWLRDLDTGEKHDLSPAEPPVSEEASGEAVEPIYGRLYLPRKFKIGIGLPEDNCIDIYTHDIGLLAIVENDRVAGYNVLVGGGLGVTPSAKKTFPALGKKLAFVPAEQALDVVTAIACVQRDHGNRSDRKVARLKYLVARWGVEKFKAHVEEQLGRPLAPATEHDVHGFDDHLGWGDQGDGRRFYGLNVENGRIADTSRHKIKSALREICETFQPGIRLTAHQSLMFTDLDADAQAGLEEILARHNVPRSEDISTVRRWSMACVALPTCGLAITESERALPGVIDHIETELARLGLSSERFTIRMTGCPNACARPYNADIGLVGKAKDKYTIYLGGRLLGDRLGFIYRDLVPRGDLVRELTPVFLYFKQDRQGDETLGDFCARKGRDDLLVYSQQYSSQTSGASE